MKQTYSILIFLIVFTIAGSATCVYFSIGYNKLSSNSKHNEIASKINVEQDINEVKKMAAYMHTNYKIALEEHSDTFASIAKILAVISVMCALALYATYKYKISNKALKRDSAKSAAPLS